MRFPTPRTLAFALTTITAGLLGLHGVLARGSLGLSCPVRPPTQAELETQRTKSLAVLRGNRRAPSRRALGFTLEETSREQFEATLRAQRRTCEEELGGALLRCDTSNPATPDERTELVARFSPDKKLVGIDRVTTSTNLEAAAKAFSSARNHLRVIYGEPTRTWGDPTASYLALPLHQAGVEYRFVDCAIDWTATQLSGGVSTGLVTREQVRAIPKEPSRGGS